MSFFCSHKCVVALLACPENKFGPNCKNDCNCKNGAKCDPVSACANKPFLTIKGLQFYWLHTFSAGWRKLCLYSGMSSCLSTNDCHSFNLIFSCLIIRDGLEPIAARCARKITLAFSVFRSASASTASVVISSTSLHQHAFVRYLTCLSFSVSAELASVIPVSMGHCTCYPYCSVSFLKFPLYFTAAKRNASTDTMARTAWTTVPVATTAPAITSSNDPANRIKMFYF